MTTLPACVPVAVPLTVTVVPASAALITLSGVMGPTVSTGAASVVSTVALSVAGGAETLPARSRLVALTLIVAPSAGLAKLTLM